MRVLGSSSGLCGSLVVISSNVGRVTKRRPGEVGLYLLSGTSHPLEEFDLLTLGEGHDGLLPGRRPAPVAAPTAAAGLLLGLGREHVHVEHVDLEQLFDGLLDLQLVGVVVHPERVLATLRVVHRLLADDRLEDDLRGVERHAYTSAIVSSDDCRMSSVSALMTSTMLSESARRMETVGRLRADSSSRSSLPAATTSTRPDALSASR